MAARTNGNAIIVRIREEQAEAYERLFAEAELPLWRELSAKGKLLFASITRVEYGTHQKAGVRDYIVHAEFAAFEGHELHDADPRFKKFDAAAGKFQPEEPFVWGGTTLHKVSARGSR